MSIDKLDPETLIVCSKCEKSFIDLKATINATPDSGVSESVLILKTASHPQCNYHVVSFSEL